MVDWATYNDVIHQRSLEASDNEPAADGQSGGKERVSKATIKDTEQSGS